MSPDTLRIVALCTGLIGSPFVAFPTDDAMHESIKRTSVPTAARGAEGSGAPASSAPSESIPNAGAAAASGVST